MDKLTSIEWNEKYQLVKSSMSRNGNLDINKSIRWWRLRLLEDCGYNKLKFRVLEYDITNYYIHYKLYLKHNLEKGSEQGFVNGIVRNYLRDLHRKEMKMKEKEYNEEIDYGINKEEPDKIYEIKEKNGIMKKMDTSEGNVFYRTLIGEINKNEGMKELHLKSQDFLINYNVYLDKIRKHFNVSEC